MTESPEAATRHGSVPDNLLLVYRHDFPDMPPPNAEVGQRYVNNLIDQAAGIEFIILDNIQSLLVGDMKEEDSCAATLHWVRYLTRQSIGQLWVHHTGHDVTRGYGSKTREWQTWRCGAARQRFWNFVRSSCFYLEHRSP